MQWCYRDITVGQVTDVAFANSRRAGDIGGDPEVGSASWISPTIIFLIVRCDTLGCNTDAQRWPVIERGNVHIKELAGLGLSSKYLFDRLPCQHRSLDEVEL